MNPKELRAAYREAFSGQSGRAVLADMLTKLYYFAPCENTPTGTAEEKMVLNNYAKRLLGDIGHLVGGDELRFVESLERKTNG